MYKDYVFDNIDVLVSYLYARKNDMNAVMLQKSLYFLYAFYAGMYYQNTKQLDFKGDAPLPNELFKAEFEAWTYGPVIKEVFEKRAQGPEYYLDFLQSKEYTNAIEEIANKSYGSEVFTFIDDLFADISSRSTFSLVQRSHEDKAWIEAFEAGQVTMNNLDIILEYSEDVRSPRR
ncbi:hypothetical protein [Psittacicella hinzii]|nr:hypothetical protein [Psittacicella hinzii]